MTLSRLSTGPWGAAVLVLLCLALYLPGIAALPVTDRDEARFAQATRQMIETGDYGHIRFQNEPRHKKPPGIHWLQAAAVKALAAGDTGAIWAYRAVSVAGATLAVLLLWGLVRPIVGPPAAFFAALALAPCLMLVTEAHIAKTDAVLLAAVIAQQGALLRLYAAARAGLTAPAWMAGLLWGALAVAALIKGPVAPVVAALTGAALALAERGTGVNGRWLAALRPAWGLAFIAAAALAWLQFQGWRLDFVAAAVQGDLWPKLVGAHESHGGPPGLYLALAPLTFFPASLLIAPAVVWAWRRRGDSAVRFALAWALPAWAMFEIVPTKLAHYVLPLYPALALMIGAAATDANGAFAALLRRWPSRAWIALVALIALALAALLPLGISYLTFRPPALAAWGAGAALALAALAGAILASRARPGAALGLSAAAVIPFFALLIAQVMPQLPLWPSREAAELVARHRATTPAAPVAVAGYGEPSLIFLLGTATIVTGGDGAARHLTANPGSLALIEAGEEAKFTAALAAQGQAVERLGTASGMNTARGRAANLTLYRTTPPRR